MGMVQGARLSFSLMVMFCHLVRLAREGIGPESEGFWRERMVSRVRVPRSEERVPVRD